MKGQSQRPRLCLGHHLNPKACKKAGSIFEYYISNTPRRLIDIVIIHALPK